MYLKALSKIVVAETPITSHTENSKYIKPVSNLAPISFTENKPRNTLQLKPNKSIQNQKPKIKPQSTKFLHCYKPKPEIKN